MKTLALLAVLSAGGLSVGCGAETVPSSASAASTGESPVAAKSVVDAGGHPLSART